MAGFREATEAKWQAAGKQGDRVTGCRVAGLEHLLSLVLQLLLFHLPRRDGKGAVRRVGAWRGLVSLGVRARRKQASLAYDAAVWRAARVATRRTCSLTR